MGSIEKLKHSLTAYGKMLKNAYIPGHKKTEIRMTMARMERELKRLQKEEMLERKKLQIEKTRSSIAKLRGSQRQGGGIGDAIERVLGPSPDYLGLSGGGRRRSSGRSKPRHEKNILGIDFDF